MAVVDDLGHPGMDAPSEDYGRQPRRIWQPSSRYSAGCC